MKRIVEAAVYRFVLHGQSDAIARLNASLAIASFLAVNLVTLGEVLLLIGWAPESIRWFTRSSIFAVMMVILALTFMVARTVDVSDASRSDGRARALNVVWWVYASASLLLFLGTTILIGVVF
jgi:hypothetical protein